MLRTAVAMSALTGRPVSIHTVRGALRRKGLTAEDMVLLDVVATSVDADIEGESGDSRLEFRPNRLPRAVRHRFEPRRDVPGGSVSVPVVAAASLPVLGAAGAVSQLTLAGSTHGANTLGFDAFELATLAAHRAQGLYAEAAMARPAFMPSVHGEVSVTVEPSACEGLDWQDRGRLEDCAATVVVAGVEKAEAEQAVDRVHQLFGEHGLSPKVALVRHESGAPEVQVTCAARFERGAGSGTAVGRAAAVVAEAAFQDFRRWHASDATVDQFLADQLLMVACLAEGKTVYTTPKVTRRLITMAWVIRQFMPVRASIHGAEGGPGKVVVER